jgi:hypothetical protein
LRPGHQLWLQEQVVPAIIARSNPWVDLYGFASKKGNTQFNMTLSKNRATAAKNFIGLQMAMKGKSIEGLVKIDHGFGEDHPEYRANESDDSPNWRAAEVIVFGTKPRIIRRPPKPKAKSITFEISVVTGGSASIFAQADNYVFQIVDILRQQTAFFHYTGVGIGISIPKIPGPGSITFSGPPTKFTTSEPAELHQFNSPASLFQDSGATFGRLSVLGTLRLSINRIAGPNGGIFTNPGIIPIEGGKGLQMPGLGSATEGVLAKVSDDFPFTGYLQ